MSQSYYIGYAFVNRKNRKLRPNALLTLRSTFLKAGPTINFWARYQRYPPDPLVNATDP